MINPNCKCTYSCPRHGKCMECLNYHRSKAQLPACYFPKDIESQYDRSIVNFIKTIKVQGTDYLR